MIARNDFEQHMNLSGYPLPLYMDEAWGVHAGHQREEGFYAEPEEVV